MDIKNTDIPCIKLYFECLPSPKSYLEGFRTQNQILLWNGFQRSHFKHITCLKLYLECLPSPKSYLECFRIQNHTWNGFHIRSHIFNRLLYKIILECLSSPKSYLERFLIANSIIAYYDDCIWVGREGVAPHTNLKITIYKLFFYMHAQ